MGIGGISIWQLAIVLAIVVLIFGTKKLRNVGGDLGAFVKNFKGSMRDGEQDSETGDADKASAKAVEAEDTTSDSEPSKQNSTTSSKH